MTCRSKAHEKDTEPTVADLMKMATAGHHSLVTAAIGRNHRPTAGQTHWPKERPSTKAVP